MSPRFLLSTRRQRDWPPHKPFFTEASPNPPPLHNRDKNYRRKTTKENSVLCRLFLRSNDNPSGSSLAPQLLPLHTRAPHASSMPILFIRFPQLRSPSLLLSASTPDFITLRAPANQTIKHARLLEGTTQSPNPCLRENAMATSFLPEQLGLTLTQTLSVCKLGHIFPSPSPRNVINRKPRKREFKL